MLAVVVVLVALSSVCWVMSNGQIINSECIHAYFILAAVIRIILAGMLFNAF